MACLLEFLLGCSGLSRCSHSEENLLRLMTGLLGASVASRVSFWAAVASRDSLACSKTRAVHLVLPCLLVVNCLSDTVISRIVPLGNKHFVVI